LYFQSIGLLRSDRSLSKLWSLYKPNKGDSAIAASI
jgi:hypothetical protein